ncbi:tRNA (guanine(46)-N(7))-methyltransferase TrmB [Chlamydiifrater phoenicopteri]|uniref:tRNA (guanine(46)-N(7))-methyltransferase TrmB n=1 Tax=Chlamydiifrater phoenicopteri TaxID=2681469 RepID=UPI001BCFB650|nr:tRNA (guanosine(46)-N7)-methyltransferase TrmB [Chlamydiifrater phoenicopteri]
MRPKDLPLPFDRSRQHVLIRDGILFIPSYSNSESDDLFSMPSWGELFSENNPICCEICSGNGDWIIDQAENFSYKNWVAVERRFDRIRKIWSKRENRGLQNLFLVCGEAQVFFRKFVLEASFSEVHVNFPDPWPKLRHHKHRLFQTDFVDDLAKAMCDRGTLSLVTDHEDFLRTSLGSIMKRFSPQQIAPYYEEIESNYGNSWFENLWRMKGKKIFQAKFENDGI